MLNSRMSTSESEWPKMHEAKITTDLIKRLIELQEPKFTKQGNERP